MDPHEELVDRASRGDRDAIEKLLERNLPRLRAYVRMRMGPGLRVRESASDLVQSTCREVLEQIDRFQYGGESSFRQWLFTTAYRKILKKVRFHRAERRDAGKEATRTESADRAAFEGLATFSTASGRLMRKEQLERLEASIAQLSEGHREVILLSKIVGLPLVDVAESIGKSEVATRSLLRRALAELAEAMDDGDGSRPG